MTIYRFPSHCSHAVVFRHAMMLVFEPIQLPFYFQTRTSDADDFFVDRCLSCGLRVTHCNNLIGGCVFNYKPKFTDDIKSVEISYPTHMIFMQMDFTSDIKIGFEYQDVIKPILLGNIYSGGVWCSGDIKFNNKDPVSIYTGFFNGLHNTDLTEFDRFNTIEYENYLNNVASDFLKYIEIPKLNIDPKSFGDIRHVQERPKSIAYHTFHNRPENSIPLNSSYVTFL